MNLFQICFEWEESIGSSGGYSVGDLVLLGEVGVSSVLSKLPGEEGVADFSSLSGTSVSSPSAEELGGGLLSLGFSGGSFSVRGRVPTKS